MSEPFFRYALFAYYTLFVVLAFVARWLIVYRRTRVNPLIVPRNDALDGYVARGLQVVSGGGALLVFTIAFVAPAPQLLGACPALRSDLGVAAGWLLLAASLLWVVIA